MSGPTSDKVWKFFDYDRAASKAICTVPTDSSGFQCKATFEFKLGPAVKGLKTKSGNDVTDSSVCATLMAFWCLLNYLLGVRSKETSKAQTSSSARRVGQS